MKKLKCVTSICLFGTNLIRLNDKPYHLGISGATKRLFQYLLISLGHDSRREYLAELFWRNATPDKQRSALNSAIWRIKRQLSGLSGIEIVSHGPTIALQLGSDVNVDSLELAEIVHSISQDELMSEQMAQRLHLALDHCDAPFLDGVNSEWVLSERERLFNLQIRGMITLMHWLGQKGRYEDALEIGRRLLDIDPAREAAQCEMMLLYVLNGQRAQAIRQYHVFRSWLKRELGIDPMLETKVLYDFIRMGMNDEKSHSLSHTLDHKTGEAKAQSIRMLLNTMSRSRRELYEAFNSQLL